MTSVVGAQPWSFTGASGAVHDGNQVVVDPGDDLITPIDAYLRAQQELTAVERFARHHDADEGPAHARHYRDLIPATPPAPGQQYAFEVDLDQCSGCKACVTACHRLNGLDDGEAFRTVGTLVGERVVTVPVEPALGLSVIQTEPWQQTITSACHHCLDPGCLNGCPVDAYEKDPVTGIVKHLDDQCIGCRYCTLTCPYEVPSYNAERGIVRKCDLCSDRLAEGEAPACVQACPTSAISIALVDTADALALAAAPDAALVPAAPPSGLTVPTTRYVGNEPPATAVPADQFAVAPGHAHWPLTIMLVLTQMAVGAFVVQLLAGRSLPAEVDEVVGPLGAFVGLAVGLLAIGASVLHLGRPLYAWRAVLGLGHSWLSREIVAFGAFAGIAAAFAATTWLQPDSTMADGLGVATAVVGAAAVGCSAMLYAVTGKRWWRLRTTAAKFGLTAVLTGAALAAVVMVTAGAVAGVPGAVGAACPLLATVLVVAILKAIVDLAVLMHLRRPATNELGRTALLLRRDLADALLLRLAAGVLGGVVLPAMGLAAWSAPNPSPGAAVALSLVVLIAVTVGELTERWLFFTAVSSPRMPGGLR